MKLKRLIGNLVEVLKLHGDIEIVDIFKNDFGDELILEGPGPKYKRVYTDWRYEDEVQ